jgi:hypothetical protein
MSVTVYILASFLALVLTIGSVILRGKQPGVGCSLLAGFGGGVFAWFGALRFYKMGIAHTDTYIDSTQGRLKKVRAEKFSMARRGLPLCAVPENRPTHHTGLTGLHAVWSTSQGAPS